jgi:hypothetical protein
MERGDLKELVDYGPDVPHDVAHGTEVVDSRINPPTALPRPPPP